MTLEITKARGRFYHLLLREVRSCTHIWTNGKQVTKKDATDFVTSAFWKRWQFLICYIGEDQYNMYTSLRYGECVMHIQST